MLVERTNKLKVGPGDDDDFGPVINERQLTNMLSAVERAQQEGAVVLAGGKRLTDAAHADGFYMAPTILENVDPQGEISTKEIFGPITCLYRVKDFSEALQLANNSPYGLTACIHTRCPESSSGCGHGKRWNLRERTSHALWGIETIGQRHPRTWY